MMHIPKAVPKTKCGIELLPQMRLLHISLNPIDRQSVRCGRMLCLRDEFAGQIHTGHVISAARQLERMTPIPTRNVQEASSRLNLRAVDNEVGLSPRLFVGDSLTPKVQSEAVKELLVPVRFHLFLRIVKESNDSWRQTHYGAGFRR